MPAWLLPFLKEFFLGVIGKMAFGIVFERLATRMVVKGLYQLADMSSNMLTREDVDILTAQLQGKSLPAAKKRAGYS